MSIMLQDQMCKSVLRAGCYERVSTDEQVLHGFSIETQIDNLTEYCKRAQIKIVDHYTDEGISGAKPPMKRPALQRLIDDVKAGKIDIIMFTKLDRWFRSVKEYFKVQEILDENNVAWKAIHEDYDTTTANGRMAITIFLAVAQNERDRTSERINVVFEHKRKNKEVCFGSVPFGYKKDRDESGKMRLVKNPDEEQATNDFWKILINDRNLNKAAECMANEYGIIKNRRSWKRISEKEIYVGTYKGVEGFCEPYISKDDWSIFNCCEKVKRNPSDSVYIFKSLLRCAECGNKLYGDKSTNQYKSYLRYRCGHRLLGCNKPAKIYETKLERKLLKTIRSFMEDEIAKIEIEQKTKKPLTKHQNDLKKLQERKRRLTVAYMAGNIADEQYLKEDADLKALIAKVSTEAPPKPKDPEPLKRLLETDFESIYLTFTSEEKQKFWMRIIKEIRIDANGNISVNFL